MIKEKSENMSYFQAVEGAFEIQPLYLIYTA